MEEELVSNSDILKAINSLDERFSNFEKIMLKNTAEIATVKENMKSLEMQMLWKKKPSDGGRSHLSGKAKQKQALASHQASMHWRKKD